MNSLVLIRQLASCAILVTVLATTAHAQTATFSRFTSIGRCYSPATTAPDPIDPNRLNIGMTSCTASAPNGSAMLMDTFSFHVEAPEGYFISKITFTQAMQTSGSRGGMGFAATNWVVDDDALGGRGSLDLSLERNTFLPVSLTTFLAAFGIQVVSGSASASNAVVVVELSPL
ncbi:MAG: hypothetical protein HOP18_08310 [Deltaproteobacteria bacterium]|nr:hypothetical protein [Deltaproteobacteria bacterium]